MADLRIFLRSPGTLQPRRLSCRMESLHSQPYVPPPAKELDLTSHLFQRLTHLEIVLVADPWVWRSLQTLSTLTHLALDNLYGSIELEDLTLEEFVDTLLPGFPSSLRVCVLHHTPEETVQRLFRTKWLTQTCDPRIVLAVDVSEFHSTKILGKVKEYVIARSASDVVKDWGYLPDRELGVWELAEYAQELRRSRALLSGMIGVWQLVTN